MIKISSYILTVLLFTVLPFNLTSAEENYFLDAVVFGSKDSSDARVDVYVVIPYQLLTFETVNDKFIANVELNINITDKDNKKVTYKNLQKTIEAANYNSSQGAKAEFVKFFYTFALDNGTYTVVANVKDGFSSNTYERKREVSVIEFGKFSLSLSGIMLLSQIEEVSGKYKITPFLSDNIGVLNNHFFAFFEVYNQNEEKEIKLGYKLLQNENIIKESELVNANIPVGTKQSFLKIDLSDLSLSGEYILQIIAYDGSITAPDKNSILAITQRSIKYDESLNFYVDANIDEAIRMMRYVANENELDGLKSIKNEAEKKEKFYLYWKELDPSPNTAFNEAMSEYYQRIKYANEQFKSYTEGWLTDMGMVYIVMGPPQQAEQQETFGNNIQYRLWRYLNNRTFLFADKNGFGNYRLERPYLFNEKYRYKK